MKKIYLLLLTMLMLGGVTATFSQTVGDYRSAATGNWTTLSTWQRYNGTTWVTPTVGQGYPGQFVGTGAVEIRGVGSTRLNTL